MDVPSLIRLVDHDYFDNVQTFRDDMKKNKPKCFPNDWIQQVVAACERRINWQYQKQHFRKEYLQLLKSVDPDDCPHCNGKTAHPGSLAGTKHIPDCDGQDCIDVVHYCYNEQFR